jgi:hypothetical protein
MLVWCYSECISTPGRLGNMPGRCGYTLRVTSHKHLIHLSTLHQHSKLHPRVFYRYVFKRGRLSIILIFILQTNKVKGLIMVYRAWEWRNIRQFRKKTIMELHCIQLRDSHYLFTPNRYISKFRYFVFLKNV